jgi:imidazole glycerol-phosphate synthase subunit HisF
MLKVRVIPCMLFDGQSIIKTIQFRERRTLGPPLQFARVYNARNVDELIFIDINATKEGREPNYSVIREMAQSCFMPLSVGGGVHHIDTVGKLLSIGADKVVFNSACVENIDLIVSASERYGNQCVIASVDTRKEVDGSYGVYIYGGTEKVSDDVVKFVEGLVEAGAGEIFLNSIDTDGTMRGYDVELLRIVSEAITVPVIGCGGAGEPDHFVEAMRGGGVDALSAASIFHYTQHTPLEIRQKLSEYGFSVRG